MSHPAKSNRHFASVSCFLPGVVFTDGLTFSLPLVLAAVSAFLNCSSPLGFSLSYFVWSASLNQLLLFYLGFPFLKLHKGTRTHAQLPRRPVPPPKPRRSKKGVSRCRLRLPASLLSSPLWFASLSFFLLLPLALWTRGESEVSCCSNEIRQLLSILVKKWPKTLQ